MIPLFLPLPMPRHMRHGERRTKSWPFAVHWMTAARRRVGLVIRFGDHGYLITTR